MSFTTFPRYQKKWGHSFTSLKDISNNSTPPPSQPSSPQQQQQQQQQKQQESQQQQQQQQQQQTTTPAVAQPRFSVFSKKPRFTSLKQQQQQQEEQQPIVKAKEIEAKDLKPTQPASLPAPEPEPAPRRFIKKFELHSKGINSNVAAANEQEEQEKQQLLSKKENDQQDLSADIMTIQTGFHTNNNNNNNNNINKKKKKSVHFDPWFLERVCLFTQTQIPNLLKSAHDKRLENPTFRIICPHWPRYSKQEEKTNTIMLDKKSVSVAKDNKSIKGKILVRNLALDKSVSVRYTFNGWNTVNDVDATFFGPYPKNPLYDIYEFSIRFGHGQLADRGEMRGKIEFSVQLTADNRDYIDNNTGRNYLIRVIADPLNNPWDGDDSMNNTVDNLSNNNNNNNNNMSDNVSDSGSTSNEQEDDDEDDREEMYYREHEVASEKDSSFTNALKGYKHARPLHLSKRQPWLGTRYDFSHSLSLAKKACTIYSNGSAELPKIEPMINASDYFLQQPTILSPQEEKEQDKEEPKTKSYPKIGGPCYSSTPLFDSKRLSPPPSPSLSPTHPPAFPMTDLCTLIDVDSNYYLDLLNKYCFYTSSSSTSTEQTFFPISSNS